MPEEHKQKISLSEKGKFVSKKTRLAMSKSHKGVRLSESHKEGMRTKRPPVSSITRAKLSSAHKRLKEQPDKYKEYIRKIFRRRVPSSLERTFQNIIDKNDLPYKFVGDGSFIINGKNPDFVNINGDKIVVEVYAEFYKGLHFNDIEIWKEKRRADFLAYGYKTFFFNEKEVREDIIIEQLGGGQNSS